MDNNQALIIPILISALVSTENIKVYSLHDRQYSETPIGNQIGPGLLAGISQSSIMDSIKSATVESGFDTSLPYLWSTARDNNNVTSLAASQVGEKTLNISSKDLFIATYPIGTDGGVCISSLLDSFFVDCQCP